MVADISLQYVQLANGERIGYRERAGGTRPLVLVHGNMTSSVHWDVFMEALPPEYKVYAVDMRGFGESSYHTPIDSLHDFALDLDDWARIVGLSSFVLMGWSTGGGVAMDFAADHPDKVEKLVLLASVGTRGYPIFKKDEHGQPDITQPLRTKEEIALDLVQVLPILRAYETRDKDTLRQIWEMLIYHDNKPDETRYDRYLEDMLTQRNLVDVDYALAMFNISSETTVMGEGNGKASKITMPVLVLSGKKDRVVPEQMALDIQKDIGENARLRYLDTGHSALIDDLPGLVRVVTEFIEE
ncbi:intracellular short-chain-length polyhydroxyalkanoate depolymerase [Aneurinibacillus danicus]|uniref:3-oxoadipate enol-lactonase n=1 Tax=Aneurinibacillus danicus TaxID=267746 RepID=A0A511V687_9BACL|nr:alpha/beta hydrolase [Aneurinibacillus danicus]GEN34455.1 3-oxoadipate enol-lactonase [Aneurinibacillus danicus]